MESAPVVVESMRPVMFKDLQKILESNDRYAIYFSRSDVPTDNALIRLSKLGATVPNMAKISDSETFDKYGADNQSIIIFDKSGKEIVRFKETDKEDVVSSFIDDEKAKLSKIASSLKNIASDFWKTEEKK